MDHVSRFEGYAHRLGDATEISSISRLPYRSRSDRQLSSTSHPSILPQQISNDIEQLQQFIKKVWDTVCHRCNANITREINVNATITQWFNDSHERGDTSITTRTCSKCGAVTCLGCGDVARKSEPRKIGDHYMSWCCLDGRILTLWMMLCRFDMIEIELRASNQQPKQSNQVRRPGNTSSGVSGVGYAISKNDPWSMMTGRPWAPRSDMPGVKLQKENPDVEDFFSWIVDVVAFTLPGSQATDDLPILLAILELSLVIDKAAELLRNDSLDDIMNCSKVYLSVLHLVEKIGKHQVLLRLVQDDRVCKIRSSGLQNISFPVDFFGFTKTSQQLLVLANDSKGQSLAKRLENLAIQSELILVVPESEPGLKRMCQQISSVYKSIKKAKSASTVKQPKEQWTDFHKANSLTFNDVILAEFLTPLRIESGQIERELQCSRTVTDRNKRILGECANMRTSLDEGTFVIVAESRPDMMRALMIGPEDTPYANGLFEFDILLPADYPRSPPKIYIKLPYPIMININLHPDGKVCLSLLGTHFVGDTIENWQPGISTILQCLLSIRAMILISDSLSQNAPVDMGTSPGETASFDRSVQAQTIWFFMLNWLVDPVKRNGVWGPVVKKHFTMRQEKILRTVKQWTLHNPNLRKWTGQLAGGGVPKLGQMMDYIPGFHGHRRIDLLEQLEKNLPNPRAA